MMSPNKTILSRTCLFLTLSMGIFIVLLINTSFKIVIANGFLFSINSVFCALIAGLYLWALHSCNLTQQRQILNQSLLTLYLFSVGVYFLINLPAGANIRDKVTYQIVFEDIPKKFFSSTLSFGMSFYLPFIYVSTKKKEFLSSHKARLLIFFGGGFSFFIMNFFLLFADPWLEDFNQIFLNSLLILGVILLIIGGVYWAFISLNNKKNLASIPEKINYFNSPIYHYLSGVSVTILLICLACEYRVASFFDNWDIISSNLLSPLILIVSNIIGELYGYKANIYFIFFLVLAELLFDFLLTMTVMLPSPNFFNLNLFYSFVIPQKIFGTVFSLILALNINAILLEKLRNTVYGQNLMVRIMSANFFATSLICIINYSLLFSGIYPYEHIFTLGWHAWIYKMICVLLSLPLLRWLIKVLSEKNIIFMNLR